MVRRAGLSAWLIAAAASLLAACSYDSPIDLFTDASGIDASVFDAPNEVASGESGADTTMPDGGGHDADASLPDADAGVADTSMRDVGPDTMSPDAGPDAPADTSVPDAAPDTSVPDAAPDTSVPDAAPDVDAGPVVCTIVPFTNGVSTLAGCEAADVVDGNRDVARFADPVNVALGPDGDVYVADFDNNRIRVVTASGTTRTLVDQHGFTRPFGMTFAPDGTFYVETDDNDISQRSLTTGTVWRVDRVSGLATVLTRNIGRPRGMLVLPSPDGRIVVSDPIHHVVSFVDPVSGAVTPLAGGADQAGWVDANGVAARFSNPYGIALLPDGRIAVADLGNHRIRAVALDGTVTTLAGTGVAGANNGATATATFSLPHDLAIDSLGNIYVADSGNFVVRKIAGGQVSTVVGSGTGGWLDDDNLLTAKLYGLEGIEVSPNGTTLWIADGSRGTTAPFNRVRVVKLP